MGEDADRQGSVVKDRIENLPATAGLVLVAHDKPQAGEHCNRGVVMLGGRVIERVQMPDGEAAHPYAGMHFDPWGEHDLGQSTAV